MLCSAPLRRLRFPIEISVHFLTRITNVVLSIPEQVLFWTVWIIQCRSTISKYRIVSNLRPRRQNFIKYHSTHTCFALFKIDLFNYLPSSSCFSSYPSNYFVTPIAEAPSKPRQFCPKRLRKLLLI